MTEQWRAVPGFEGAYEVSDQGRVRDAHKLRIKKASPSTRGYLCVWLYRGGKHTVKNKLVSRLVLEAFSGSAPTKAHQAAHADGDVANNQLANLRWATPLENDKDKDRHGTRLVRVGVALGRGVLDATAVERIRDLRILGCTQRQISTWIKTSISNVSYVLTRRTWAHV